MITRWWLHCTLCLSSTLVLATKVMIGASHDPSFSSRSNPIAVSHGTTTVFSFILIPMRVTPS